MMKVSEVRLDTQATAPINWPLHPQIQSPFQSSMQTVPLGGIGPTHTPAAELAN